MACGRTTLPACIHEDIISSPAIPRITLPHRADEEKAFSELSQTGLPETDTPVAERRGGGVRQPHYSLQDFHHHHRSEGCLLHVAVNHTCQNSSARRKSMNDVMLWTSLRSTTSSMELQDAKPEHKQKKPSLLHKVKSLWTRYMYSLNFTTSSSFASTDHANVCQGSRMIQHSHDMDPSIIDMF